MNQASQNNYYGESLTHCITPPLVRGLVVCIIDHYPLGNQRNIGMIKLILVKNLGWTAGMVLEPGLFDIASSRATVVLLRTGTV